MNTIMQYILIFLKIAKYQVFSLLVNINYKSYNYVPTIQLKNIQNNYRILQNRSLNRRNGGSGGRCDLACDRDLVINH